MASYAHRAHETALRAKEGVLEVKTQGLELRGDVTKSKVILKGKYE